MLSRVLLKHKLLTCASSRYMTIQAKNMRLGDAIRVIGTLGEKDHSPRDVEAVNEYFRLNFRKIQFDEACTLLSEVADVYDLEDQFWVWETIEEAIRPEIFSCSDEQFDKIKTDFQKMYKGSSLFWQDMTDRQSSRVSIF